MDGNVPRQFGIYLLFWILYFTVLSSICLYIYRRIRERPPKEGKRLVPWEGQTVTAGVAWEERDRLLRKKILRIGMGFMVLPLLLPLLLRLIS